MMTAGNTTMRHPFLQSVTPAVEVHLPTPPTVDNKMFLKHGKNLSTRCIMNLGCNSL